MWKSRAWGRFATRFLARNPTVDVAARNFGSDTHDSRPTLSEFRAARQQIYFAETVFLLCTTEDNCFLTEFNSDFCINGDSSQTVIKSL